MTFKVIVQWPFILACLFVLVPTKNLYAESSVRVFHTQQTAQTILSTIAPLYGKTVKFTARNNTLIVKAPGPVLMEIEQLINEIDIPLRNLLIEVTSTQDNINNLQENGLTGRVQLGDRSVITNKTPKQNRPDMSIRYGKNGSIIKTTHTRRSISQNSPDHFKITALEGKWSFIQTGQKVPYYSANQYNKNHNNNKYFPRQNSVQLVDVTSGFEVYPVVNGEQVLLKIRPHNNSMNQEYPDRINTRSMNTTVTGKVGQWIYLGGTMNQNNEKSKTSGYSTRRKSSLDTTYKIKVSVIK
jgi:type II secretory pathway component HofQ